MSVACGLCGRDPAAGFAVVDGRRYCHGDFDAGPTCYMRASSPAAAGVLALVDLAFSAPCGEPDVSPDVGAEIVPFPRVFAWGVGESGGAA